MIEPSELFDFSPEPAASGGYVVRWNVPVSLPYFDGHFPGAPVLPAIAILDASVEMIRRIEGKGKLTLKGVPSAKLTGPVGPGDAVVITVLPSVGGEWDVTWRDLSDKVLARLCVAV